MSDSVSPSLAVIPKEIPEWENLLRKHERLCLEDLFGAFRELDASRAIAPVTMRILESRADILASIASHVLTPEEAQEILDLLDNTNKARGHFIDAYAKLRSLATQGVPDGAK